MKKWVAYYANTNEAEYFKTFEEAKKWLEDIWYCYDGEWSDSSCDGKDFIAEITHKSYFGFDDGPLELVKIEGEATNMWNKLIDFLKSIFRIKKSKNIDYNMKYSSISINGFAALRKKEEPKSPTN
jgi:hypothetical protein